MYNNIAYRKRWIIARGHIIQSIRKRDANKAIRNYGTETILKLCILALAIKSTNNLENKENIMSVCPLCNILYKARRQLIRHFRDNDDRDVLNKLGKISFGIPDYNLQYMAER